MPGTEPEPQAPLYLNIKAVVKRTGVSRSRIYELMAQRKFPLPIQPGGWRNLWLEEEIQAFLEKLKAARPTLNIGRR